MKFGIHTAHIYIYVYILHILYVVYSRKIVLKSELTKYFLGLNLCGYV